MTNTHDAIYLSGRTLADVLQEIQSLIAEHGENAVILSGTAHFSEEEIFEVHTVND